MAVMIDGKTRVCGLLGNPVEHSFSPAIHNFLAEQMGLPMVYTTFCVEPERIVQAVQGGFALNILGFNVTVPYKQAVTPALVGLDAAARGIGAVNTLVRQEDGFAGYNTDWLGLQKLLARSGIALKGKRVVLLGAGGAANAAAYLCGYEQAAEVYILNRTVHRAEELAGKMQTQFAATGYRAMALSDWTKIPGRDRVALQTTSVGLYPHTDEALIEEDAFYQKLSAAVDVVYNPEVTGFMRLAQKHGVQAVNGLDMLLFQAIAAFELWNGCEVPQALVQKTEAVLKAQLPGAATKRGGRR